MRKFLVSIIPLPIIEFFERWLLADYDRAKSFLQHMPSDVFHAISDKKVLAVFKHAAKTVPAYQSFLIENHLSPNQISSTALYNTVVPITTKENYIKKYSYEARCVGGKFPCYGNIDESSGTSGKPTNWIRSIKEEDLLFKMAEFEFNYIYKAHRRNLIVLSAWSSGAWATGIKFCQLMEHYTLVKNTDTDIPCIINTLKTFGKNYDYLIAGYPPFLKRMIDEGNKQIKWKDYKIDILTGGEGIVLEWKHFMQKSLRDNAIIVSSYGASDIDIGIGFETPFSNFIRELCVKNKDLRRALFGDLPTLPMIFQYNPTMHYISNVYNDATGKQEYVITLLDKRVASPKIRYNLQDEGGVYTYEKMISLLEHQQADYVALFRSKKNIPEEVLRLPFLYVAGRSDGTISIDGANVYPHQIELCLHKEKSLAKKVNAFKIARVDDIRQNTHFHVKLQLKKGVRPSKGLAKQFHNAILHHLLELNGDYKEAYINNKPAADPKIVLYKFNASAFTGSNTKIKQEYIG